MPKVIYSKKGIVGSGHQNGALEYYTGISEDYINALDRKVFDVEVYEDVYIIDGNNPAREDTIYCGGFVSCTESFCLYVDHTELDIVLKNYNDDIQNVEQILKLNSFPEDHNCYSLLNSLCYLGIYNAMERFLVDLATACFYENEQFVEKCVRNNDFMGQSIKGNSDEEKRLTIFQKIRMLKMDSEHLHKFFNMFSPQAAEIICPISHYKDVRNDLVHRNGYYKDCVYKKQIITSKYINEMKNEFNIYVNALYEALRDIVRKEVLDI